MANFFSAGETVKYTGPGGGILVGAGGISIEGVPGAPLAVTGGVTANGVGAGNAVFTANGAAASSRIIRSQTSGVNRWQLFLANSTAESGADAGSNLSLQAFTDAGVAIDTPITCARVAGGTMVFGGGGRPITLSLTNQGLRLNGQVDAAAAQAGTLLNAPVAGNPTFWCPINIAGVVKAFPCW